MNTSPTRHPLVVKLLNYLPIVEKIFLAALCVGIPLMITGTDTTVAQVSFTGLAVTFFLYAYRPIDGQVHDDKPFSFKELLGLTILPKVMWLSCAVAVNGLHFTLLGFVGYQEMLLIGVTSGVVSTFLFAVLWIGGIEQIKVVAPVLLRIVPLFVIDTYYLLTKTDIM